MQHALRTTALAAMLVSVPALSQVMTGHLSLDTPTDPRAAAMGESFVALPGNASALMFNPAGLADLQGIQATYARRETEYTPGNGGSLQGAFGSITTTIGTLGFLYSRNSLGQIPVTNETYPGGTGSFFDLHDAVAGVGIAHSFSANWSAGLAVKTFTSSTFPSNLPVSQTRPYLFDFGLMFEIPDALAGEKYHDRLAIGLSAQNVGTDYRIRYENSPLFHYAGESNEYIVYIPRYMRLGFSYELTRPGEDNLQLSPVGLLVTGEYRMLSNAPLPFARDFWGLGMEIAIFEIFKVRLGGYAQPYVSINGDNGTLHARYGFGFAIPLTRIGVNMPLVLTADAAALPMVSGYFSSDQRSTLFAYSLTLQLDRMVF